MHQAYHKQQHECAWAMVSLLVKCNVGSEHFRLADGFDIAPAQGMLAHLRALTSRLCFLSYSPRTSSRLLLP